MVQSEAQVALTIVLMNKSIKSDADLKDLSLFQSPDQDIEFNLGTNTIEYQDILIGKLSKSQ